MTLNYLPLAEQKKIAAWTACRVYRDWPRAEWRVDRFGYLIRRADHGKQTEYGWEIDHVRPLALGGSDTLDNLQALHWRRNRQLGALVGHALNPQLVHPRGLFGRR